MPIELGDSWFSAKNQTTNTILCSLGLSTSGLSRAGKRETSQIIS